MDKNQYDPEDVSPPGETLGELLDDRGLSAEDLSSQSGIAAEVIVQLIAGAAPLTPEISFRLEKALQVPAHFWDQRERNYRQSLSRTAPAKASTGTDL
jgi:plasmid maintenance system antidote protein VapI